MLKEYREDMYDFSVYANRSKGPDVLTTDIIEVRGLKFLFKFIQINIRVIFLLFDKHNFGKLFDIS